MKRSKKERSAPGESKDVLKEVGALALASGSYGNELEQESRLEGLVQGFLTDLGVFADTPAIGEHASPGDNRRRCSRWALTNSGTRRVVGAISRSGGGFAAGRDRHSIVSDLEEARGSRGSRSVDGRFCRESAKFIPVLRFGHPFLRAFDTLTLLIVIYLAVVLPLFVGWRGDLTKRGSDVAPWTALHMFIDFVFILDMGVSSRRAFYKDGVAVLNPYLVALRYARTDLPYDLAGGVPYLSVAHALSNGARQEKTLVSVFIFMLSTSRVVMRLMRQKVPPKRAMSANSPVTRLFQILLLLLLACHWMGCIWWAVSQWEVAQPKAQTSYWRPSDEILAQTGFLQWGHSFLWGASIVSGFILYDVTPLTGAEVVVTAVSLLFGMMFNTVIISSTTSLLSSIDTRRAFGRQRLENISNYLNFKSVRPEISSRIVDFYAYKLTTSAFSLQDVDFTELPTDLAMVLTLELHKSLLKKCYIFSALPPRMLVPLLRQLQPLVAVPGEVVVREGHVNEKLFFIHRGSVQVYVGLGPSQGSPAEQKLVATLGDNDFFGEASLLPPEDARQKGNTADGKASATIVCFSYCEFLTLSKQQLDGPLLQHMDFKSAISQGVAQRMQRQRQEQGETRRTSFIKKPTATTTPAASKWKMAAVAALKNAPPTPIVERRTSGSFDRMKRAAQVGPPFSPPKMRDAGTSEAGSVTYNAVAPAAEI
jgi:CRP-like cAMP-binding protein